MTQPLAPFYQGTVLSRVTLKSLVKYGIILGDTMTTTFQFADYDLMIIPRHFRKKYC